MTKDVRNSQQPAYRGHMYFEDGKNSYYETTKDYERFENAQFANSCVKFLAKGGQMASLLREDNMIIIRKNACILYTINFEKTQTEADLLDSQQSPLNALYKDHQHVVPTQYSNIAISMRNHKYYINVYSKSLKKWEEIEIESIDEPEKVVLEPFLKNIYHQVWELHDGYNDMKDINFSFRGGNLGTFHQLHIDLNKTNAKLDDDVECIYSSQEYGLAIQEDLKIGRQKLLEEALPIEFLKYQKPTDDAK